MGTSGHMDATPAKVCSRRITSTNSKLSTYVSKLVDTSKSVAASDHIDAFRTVGHIESHGRFLLCVQPSDHIGTHGQKFDYKCVHSNDHIGMDGSLTRTWND